MFSTRYFIVVLFSFVLWKTVSVAEGKRGNLGEPSDISKESTAISYFDFKYNSRRLCEMKPFMDGKFLQHTEDDKVMCSSEDPCRKNQRYQKRFGKNKGKRAGEDRQERAGHYETSKDVVQDKGIHYWKEKAINCLNFMNSKTGKNNYRKKMADEVRNKKESEYKTYLAIVVALAIPVVVSVFYVRENKHLRKSLKETIAEGERLREELSEREMFHNIQETNYKPFEIQ